MIKTKEASSVEVLDRERFRVQTINAMNHLQYDLSYFENLIANEREIRLKKGSVNFNGWTLNCKSHFGNVDVGPFAGGFFINLTGVPKGRSNDFFQFYVQFRYERVKEEGIDVYLLYFACDASMSYDGVLVRGDKEGPVRVLLSKNLGLIKLIDEGFRGKSRPWADLIKNVIAFYLFKKTEVEGGEGRWILSQTEPAASGYGIKRVKL